MGSTLSAALWYARKGWPILPVWGVDVDEEGTAVCHCGNDECTVQGKHPVSYLNGKPVVPRGVKDATTDVATIKQWWSRYPNSNIGAAATEWFALDIDRQDARLDLGKLPDTVESISGSGGEHILFNQPKDWKVGNATGDLPHGIDVRGCSHDGAPYGYIILPPSMHKSGTRYTWEVSSHPRDIPIADAPQWLLDILHVANKEKESVEIESVETPLLETFDISKATKERIINGHASGEDRSKMDMRVCCALVEASATPSEIAAIFHEYPIGTAGKMADHNAPEDYLQRTIESAFSWTVAKTPRLTVPSKIQPKKNVTEEEAIYEERALNLAYHKAWMDALASNPAMFDLLWPQYLTPSPEMIKEYGIGANMAHKIEGYEENEYAALAVPYYDSGEIVTVDFTIHEPPDQVQQRFYWTDNGEFIFDTAFDRAVPITGAAVVTGDFDEAIRLQEMGLQGYDLLALPASEPSQQRQRLRELAKKLADSEHVILLWPNDRRHEGLGLAKMMEEGIDRVLWASIPADLKDMFKVYALNSTQLERILRMAAPVIS